MPDWRQFVRERLGSLGLSPDREEEIRAELADHLEDQSQHTGGPATGIDWKSLACEIRRAEEDAMSHTARTIWVPGMTGLFGATLVLFTMTRLVPPTAWVGPRPPVLLLGVWLVSYLTFGGLGAYWSRRAGGRPAERFLAGIFPLALHLAIFICPIVIAVLFDVTKATPFRFDVANFPEHRDAAWLLKTSVGWVFIPGVVLALGALPFLRDKVETAPAKTR